MQTDVRQIRAWWGEWVGVADTVTASRGCQQRACQHLLDTLNMCLGYTYITNSAELFLKRECVIESKLDTVLSSTFFPEEANDEQFLEPSKVIFNS